MQVSDLVGVMDRIAPLRHAESWDRVGLQVGALDSPLAGPVLLTIDLTERVIDEAVSFGASAVVAYHPPIFSPLDAVTDRTPKQRIILTAARAGIAVYSPHTALDAAPGGVTDWLCEGLSGSTEAGRIAGDCRALEPHTDGAAAPTVKIVTFVPEAEAERVRNALATAGAGRIGDYELCSFAAPGTGTFFGAESTNPAVGERGRFESAPELRLEMVCPRPALALALETLRRLHPYEEPAIDVYELLSQPLRSVGAGRRLVLDQPASPRELGARLREWLGTARVQLASLTDDDRPVTTLGVVPGAGESLAGLARREGCELFVTGEMRHHNVLAALHDGMHVLLAGHTNTERGYLPRLARALEAELPGLKTRISQRDTDPLVVL
jgi:dinuclear metal center YbgI/SA1388 family protein